jgi:hypothetical protein
MKILIFVFSLLAAFVSPSWGISIDNGTTDVGLSDTLISSTNSLSNSSKATETAWVNSLLGSTSVTFFAKEETVSYYATDTDYIFAFSLSNTAEYYIIKNATFWALYQNIGDLNWAVFDASELDDSINLLSSDRDGYTISHVSQFESTSTTVPEPSTTLLLGVGILGLGLYSRRRHVK